MKHVRDLYFHEDTQGYSFEEKSHHPYLGHRKLYIDVAKQIHSSVNLTMAIAITLIGQALISLVWFWKPKVQSLLSFGPLIYGEREIEAVSKLVVQVANDILILQFLVNIVTTHGLRFYFYLFVHFFYIFNLFKRFNQVYQIH